VILKGKNGLFFLQFPSLEAYPELFHAVFTRWGGFSEPPFDSLNMSMGLGDDPRRVTKNRGRIVQCAGGGEPVFMHQVHGDGVWILKAGRGETGSKRRETPRADAAATDVPGKLLVVQAADCQPVFLYHPERRVIAIIHSGWRGSIANITGRTVRILIDAFDCRPENVIAGIGPSLGPCCAEFRNYIKEIPPAFWRYKDSGCHFDFWSLTQDQLCEAGLSEDQVHVSGLCTRCRTDLFFSYREKTPTGRFAAVIGLLDAIG
jgi:YfiH family protein